MKNIINIVFITIVIAFASCHSHKTESHEEESEHHDEHDEHNESTNLATLTAEQMKSIQIEFGNIEKKQLTATLKLNGLLRVPNNYKANVTALFGGVVNSILVQNGNAVNKGQVLATITNTAFIPMQEEYLTVTARLELAEIELTRQIELQQGNATALKNLQMAETEKKTLQAKKASLQKQLELLGINVASLTSDNIQSVVSIKSPINGIVSDILVNIGSYTDTNNPIAEIVDNNQLHLDLYVYEKDLPKLKIGQTIHFTLTNNPGKEYDADLYAISNTFEPNTKAIVVHARVKGNRNGLIDGMSITALVSLDNVTSDAVPTNAIVNHEGQDYIFVLTDSHNQEEHHEEENQEEKETTGHQHDESGHSHSEKEEPEHIEVETTFEKVPIRKGTTDIGYSEITLLKEIPANSKVVTNGAFFILAKMNNKGEGHQH